MASLAAVFFRRSLTDRDVSKVGSTYGTITPGTWLAMMEALLGRKYGPGSDAESRWQLFTLLARVQNLDLIGAKENPPGYRNAANREEKQRMLGEMVVRARKWLESFQEYLPGWRGRAMAVSAAGPPLDGLQRKEAKAVERMLGEPEQLAERLREYATNESRLLLSIAQGADQDLRLRLYRGFAWRACCVLAGVELKLLSRSE